MTNDLVRHRGSRWLRAIKSTQHVLRAFFVRLRFAATFAASAAVALSACGGPSLPNTGLQGRNILADASKRCSTDRVSKPYLIQLSSSDRGELEGRLRQGLALVRYSGCELEIIQGCAAAAELKYAYVSVTPKNEVVRMTTVDEIYANVPIGGAELAAKLESSGEIRIESRIVGRYESPAMELKLATLEGPECKLATHAVRAITAGAFELFSGSQDTSGGKVGVDNVAIGGRSETTSRVLTSDGELLRCGDVSTVEGPPRSCGALIRAELISIDQRPVDIEPAGHRCPPDMVFVPYEGCQPIARPNSLSFVQTPPTGDATQEPVPNTASSAEPRFVTTGGAVFDTTSGLTWQRNNETSSMTWQQAKQYCLGLSVDDAADWRLPKKKELLTLVDATQPGAKIDTASFPGTPASYFWSMSADSDSTGDAWAVDFHSGKPKSKGSGSMFHVRCIH